MGFARPSARFRVCLGDQMTVQMEMEIFVAIICQNICQKPALSAKNEQKELLPLSYRGMATRMSLIGHLRPEQ